MAARILKFAGLLAAATACCYLGLLASRLIWYGPLVAAGAFSDGEIHRWAAGGLVPRLRILPPTDGPWLAFAVYSAGSVIFAIGLLAVAPALVRRFRGWSRLLLAFSVFWTVVSLAESIVVLWRWGRGSSLASAARVFGISQIGPIDMTVPLACAVAALGCFALYRIASSFSDPAASCSRERMSHLLAWLILPVSLLVLAPAEWGLSSRWLSRMGLSHVPTVLIASAAFAAALRPLMHGRAFQPGWQGALLSLAAGGVAVSATLSYNPDLEHTAPAFQADRLTTEHWSLQFEKGMFSVTQRQRWGSAADQRLEEAAGRLGIDLGAEKLHANLYASADRKREQTGERRNDSPFTVSHEPLMLHQLLDQDGEPADPRGEALLLLEKHWGKAGSPEITRAVARYAIGSFHGHSLSDYADRIACEERPYKLREILQIDGHYLSPLVRDALGGAWVERFVESHGVEILPELYRTALEAEIAGDTARFLAASWPQHEERWQSGLSSKEACREKPPARTSPVWHRGISFSHEVGGNSGYGSDIAEVQLEKIRALGADAIAIVPYVFTRAPEETRIWFRTDESDERVVRTVAAAKQLGLRTTLKIHLWSGRFTGEIAFASDDRFKKWFSQYRAWVLHNARLAELHDIDLFVIGNELQGVTTREQAWRELVRATRRVYSGELTYASNWDEEFEAVAFWDDLDYIGVNNYFPMAARGGTPSADSPKVRAVVSRLEALSKRFGKPVLFTEVGFPSLSSAAAEPWRETNAPLDPELQQRGYEVIFQAFARRPWFAGMYWWKWPTHGRGGPFDPTFSPIGKPALEVLQNWYGDPELRGRIRVSD